MGQIYFRFFRHVKLMVETWEFVAPKPTGLRDEARTS